MNLWKLSIPHKIKVFMWKGFYNVIPVSEKLIKRKIPIDPSCKLCNYDFESTFHVLFQCALILLMMFGKKLGGGGILKQLVMEMSWV